MFGNFFRTQKDKKKAPVRASFRPMLESLEERAVPASLSLTGSLFGNPADPTPAASSTQATSSATSNPTANIQAITTITTDMVNVGNAGAALMKAQSSGSSTNIGTALATYISTITTLFSDIRALYPTTSNTITSPPSYIPNSTGGNQSTFSLIPSSSSTQTPQSNLLNGSTALPYQSVV